jgi:hypothetical protein
MVGNLVHLLHTLQMEMETEILNKRVDALENKMRPLLQNLNTLDFVAKGKLFDMILELQVVMWKKRNGFEEGGWFQRASGLMAEAQALEMCCSICLDTIEIDNIISGGKYACGHIMHIACVDLLPTIRYETSCVRHYEASKKQLAKIYRTMSCKICMGSMRVIKKCPLCMKDTIRC